MSFNNYSPVAARCKPFKNMPIWWNAIIMLTSVMASFNPDSPPNKDQLGRAAWTLLHTVTMAYPDTPTEDHQTTMRIFFESFGSVYPCASCSHDFLQMLQVSPPETDSKVSLTQWLCRIHNEVNRKIGKPEFPCANIYARWDATAVPVLATNPPCPCALKKLESGQAVGNPS